MSVLNVLASAAIWCGATSGVAQILDLLLSEGAKVRVRSRFERLWLWFSEHRPLELLRLLLSQRLVFWMSIVIAAALFATIGVFLFQVDDQRPGIGWAFTQEPGSLYWPLAEIGIGFGILAATLFSWFSRIARWVVGGHRVILVPIRLLSVVLALLMLLRLTLPWPDEYPTALAAIAVALSYVVDGQNRLLVQAVLIFGVVLAFGFLWLPPITTWIHEGRNTRSVAARFLLSALCPIALLALEIAPLSFYPSMIGTPLLWLFRLLPVVLLPAIILFCLLSLLSVAWLLIAAGFYCLAKSAELLLLRLAEHPKGPVLGASALLTALGMIFKVFS